MIYYLLKYFKSEHLHFEPLRPLPVGYLCHSHYSSCEMYLRKPKKDLIIQKRVSSCPLSSGPPASHNQSPRLIGQPACQPSFLIG